MYSLVPFEGTIHLIKSRESVPLSPEQIEIVDKAMSEAGKIELIQDVLEEVWNGN